MLRTGGSCTDLAFQLLKSFYVSKISGQTIHAPQQNTLTNAQNKIGAMYLAKAKNKCSTQTKRLRIDTKN
jgi:hypothetical protein